MLRLTSEMKTEIFTIEHRIVALYEEFFLNAPLDQHLYQSYRLNSQHGDELESYKIKIENFYSETDVKEQTFQDFQSDFWNY